MATPIEMQPTMEYLGAASMQGASSAEGVSEVRAVGPIVVAAIADDGKAPPGWQVGPQQVSFAETRKYPPSSDQQPAGTYVQPQQQPPSYAAAARLQQPMTTASTAYPWNHQVSLSQGVAAMGTLTTDASATGDTTVWMPMPLVMTLCPPGLEYLAELSQLNFAEELVMIPIGLSEGLTARQRRRLTAFPRRFTVRNTQEQRVYLADTMTSGVLNEIVLAFSDSAGKTLMTVAFTGSAMPLCCIAACGQCLLNGTVESPPGNVVGTVEQRSPGGSLSFVIRNAEGSPVLYLEAPDPCCVCMDCRAEKPTDSPYKQFAIFSLDYEHMVGKIEAQPTMNMSFDSSRQTNVALVFPPDLDVKVKATLAGAAIMLHCFFFRLHARGSQRSAIQRNRRTEPSNSIFNETTNPIQNYPTGVSYNNHWNQHISHQSSHAIHSTSHHHSHH